MIVCITVKVYAAASIAFVLAAACTQTAGPVGGSATPPAAPEAASPSSLAPFFGSYRTDDQRLFVIARLGWFFDPGDATYRTIYAGASPNRFTFGPAFAIPLPMVGDLLFEGDTLALTTAGSTVSAHRVAYRQTDVAIPASGATLAGTITEPMGPGRHPGIVIVHGSEPGERYFYDIWVGVYTSLGLTVLTYDKRGVGASSGGYPGEFPSVETLQLLADDASAALRFLSGWPGVDAKRVGFHGGSQGGWTVPLAIERHGLASFAILLSAPATTVGQTTIWSGFTGGGAFPPNVPAAEIDAAVLADHSGYDPGPALAALRVPTLWLLGTHDRKVPTIIGAGILAGMHRANFTVTMLPTGHGLLVNATGLDADDERSPGLGPTLVPVVTAWLKAQLG